KLILGEIYPRSGSGAVGRSGRRCRRENAAQAFLAAAAVGRLDLGADNLERLPIPRRTVRDAVEGQALVFEDRPPEAIRPLQHVREAIQDSLYGKWHRSGGLGRLLRQALAVLFLDGGNGRLVGQSLIFVEVLAVQCLARLLPQLGGLRRRSHGRGRPLAHCGNTSTQLRDGHVARRQVTLVALRRISHGLLEVIQPLLHCRQCLGRPATAAGRGLWQRHSLRLVFRRLVLGLDFALAGIVLLGVVGNVVRVVHFGEDSHGLRSFSLDDVLGYALGGLRLRHAHDARAKTLAEADRRLNVVHVGQNHALDPADRSAQLTLVRGNAVTGRRHARPGVFRARRHSILMEVVPLPYDTRESPPNNGVADLNAVVVEPVEGLESGGQENAGRRAELGDFRDNQSVITLGEGWIGQQKDALPDCGAWQFVLREYVGLHHFLQIAAGSTNSSSLMASPAACGATAARIAEMASRWPMAILVSVARSARTAASAESASILNRSSSQDRNAAVMGWLRHDARSSSLASSKRLISALPGSGRSEPAAHLWGRPRGATAESAAPGSVAWAPTPAAGRRRWLSPTIARCGRGCVALAFASPLHRARPRPRIRRSICGY